MTTKSPVCCALGDIRQAAENISPYAHRTPVVTCETLNRLSGCHLVFKCENFQKAGAFKFRGATNAITQLPAESRTKGVVTHSSGNHAQALARAARIFEIPAWIVMPTTASKIKRAAVVEYGGQVIECEPTLAAREETALRVQQETGAELIPPYDDPRIIAGQGTAALELMDQVADLDAIIAPVGGGGLLSGTAIAAKSLAPAIRVIGAEPAGADDAYRSKKSGQWVPQTAPQTIADGLLTSVGKLNWPIIDQFVDEIVTVSEQEIIEAMRIFLIRTKIIIEPSSAVAVAVAMNMRDSFGNVAENKPLPKIGVILSGGNVDLDRLPW